MSRVDRPAVFESLIVARTLSNWSAEKCSVVVQVTNASSASISLPKGLVLGTLFTVTVVDPAQLHVNAVAKTPSTPVELR